MNQDFTITDFNEPITALENTPQMSAAELKRRFQAPSDELREAHNALAESHAVLDEKVGGIVERTFGGAIEESMLDTALAGKLNAKADQSAIATFVSMEYGFYTGDGVYPREIVLGYQPKALLVFRSSGAVCSNSYVPYALVFPETNETEKDTFCKLTENGFALMDHDQRSRLNYTGFQMCYLALK